VDKNDQRDLYQMECVKKGEGKNIKSKKNEEILFIQRKVQDRLVKKINSKNNHKNKSTKDKIKKNLEKSQKLCKI
jgi:hypothetical protein